MTYPELKNALHIFGFSEHDLLTMRHIKKRQRELSRNNHPDLCDDSSSRDMHTINSAAAVLLEYLSGYRFSFSEEEFYRQNPDERLRLQFSNDSIWGAS